METLTYRNSSQQYLTENVFFSSQCCLSHCLKHECSSWGACYGQIYFASLHLRVLQTWGRLPSLPWQCLVTRNLIRADTMFHVKVRVEWGKMTLVGPMFFKAIQLFQCHLYAYFCVCKHVFTVYTFICICWAGLSFVVIVTSTHI